MRLKLGKLCDPLELSERDYSSPVRSPLMSKGTAVFGDPDVLLDTVKSSVMTVRELIARFEKATQAVNNILDRLGLSYLDLCLIHWPGVAKLDAKSSKNSKLRSETWRALEQFYKQGICRAIGVSNYTEKHLDELISSCEIKPMVNQMEVHPWLAQPQLRNACNLHGVVVQAYSPLGVGSLLKDSTVQTVASNCRRSPAQVLLRWGIQNDLVVLPKSVHEEYIVENQDIFSFSLSDEDMASLNSLDCGHHFCWSAEDVL